MIRLAIFFSHPTQHHAPWFRAIAATGEVDLQVYYYHPGLTLPAGGYDCGFDTTFQWDIPLLEGYNYTFLPPLVNKGLSHITVNRQLLSTLHSWPWDAVLVAGYAHLNNWVVAAASKYFGIPVLHFCDSNLFTQARRLKQMVKEHLVRSYFTFITRFLFIGDHNYDFYRHYGVKREQLQWCPYPVDIRRFISPSPKQLAELRQRYEISEDSKVVLFVGKLIPRKRPMDLVQALHRLPGNKKVIGVFVGEGPLREEIRMNGGDQVRITGFINQTDMPAHYGLGDVLCMTSVHDPHPLVITEAAALGVPAVISDLCGCYGPRDVLREGENGFIYPCGDVDSLVARLNTILNDKPLHRQMGDRGRELALTQDVTVAARAIINAVKTIGNSYGQ